MQTSNAAGAFAKALTIRITDNKSPSAPALTTPADSATDIALNTKLAWAASSDPEGDAISYTVLLGTASIPRDTVSRNQVGIEYTPTGLKTGTKYYWQIVATDAAGEKAVSSIRSYTTKVCRSATVTIGDSTYKTVAIGTDCWMAENLSYDGHDAGNSYCYNDQSDSCAVYGRLYDTAAVRNIESKVTGWHLSTLAEWQQAKSIIDEGGPKGTLYWANTHPIKLQFGGVRAADGTYSFAGNFIFVWGYDENTNQYLFSGSSTTDADGATIAGFQIPASDLSISVRLVQDK